MKIVVEEELINTISNTTLKTSAEYNLNQVVIGRLTYGSMFKAEIINKAIKVSLIRQIGQTQFEEYNSAEFTQTNQIKFVNNVENGKAIFTFNLIN